MRLTVSRDGVAQRLENRTLNQEDTGSNRVAADSNRGQFVSLHFASVHSTVFLHEYLAIDNDGYI